MAEFPNRKKNRLQGDLYCQPGAYFITICADKHSCVFWTDSSANVADDLPLSATGMIAQQHIIDIPSHYDKVLSIDKYVVMPNHVHILFAIHPDEILKSPDIRHVVRHYKSAVTHHIGYSVWQKGFHDRIVRDMREYSAIWKYIDENPVKWIADEYYANQ